MQNKRTSDLILNLTSGNIYFVLKCSDLLFYAIPTSK